MRPSNWCEYERQLTDIQARVSKEKMVSGKIRYRTIFISDNIVVPANQLGGGQTGPNQFGNPLVPQNTKINYPLEGSFEIKVIKFKRVICVLLPLQLNILISNIINILKKSTTKIFK